MKVKLSFQISRFSCLGLALILLFSSLFIALKSLTASLQHLEVNGWIDYLNSYVLPMFFVDCLLDKYCRDALGMVFGQTYPRYLPFSTLIFLWASGVLNLLSEHKLKLKTSGGMRWAVRKDLNLYLNGEDSSPQRGYVGLAPKGKPLRLPERLRCAHTLIIGATGARKSTGYHKPNLVMDAQEGVSAIVIDLKYPDTTSGFFDLVPLFVKAGHAIQLFLPYSESTMRLPLLQYADSLQGASEIADMIVPTSKNEGAEFYHKQERLLLIGLLMGMARLSTPSLGAIFRLLSQGRSGIQAYFHKHPDNDIRERVKGLFDLDARTFAGIISGLAGELQAFDDPRLERATTESENPKENIDLEAIGLRSTLLYIGIPQQHLQGTRAPVLLKLIKRVIDLALLKTANSHGGKLPNHTSFYLDEFANLGVLPNVSENFATMRSRRVAYHVSLQNRAQGEALYGRDQFRSFFTNNFQQVILFPRSLKFEDAEYFSKALGMKAVLDKSKGSSHEGFFTKRRRSELIREVAEPLLSVEAMMTWPEEKAILLASGVPPVQVLLPRLDEAKILGTKNPLHRFYQDTQMKQKPEFFAEVLLDKRIKKPKENQENQENQQDVTALLEPTAAPMTPLSKKEETSFPKWINKLLEHAIKTKLHLNPRTYKLSKLSLLDVPKSLKQEKQLEIWMQKGWIKLTNHEIGLLGEGIKLLSKEQLEKLKKLESKKNHKPQTKKSRQAEQLAYANVSKLRQYIQSKDKYLKGHNTHESLPEANKPEPIGLYQPCTVLLDKNYFETLLQFSFPTQLKARKEGPQGKQRWVVELTLSELKGFPKLAKWYQNNAHLLKRHPNFEPAKASDAGVFLPEIVSLPKQTLIDILGKIPNQAKPSRPTLNGKRPYLMALELPTSDSKKQS